MPNIQMPVAPRDYEQGKESQFRQQLTQIFNQLAQSASIDGSDAPDVIVNQSWWLIINESTQAVTLYYQDSSGVQHTLALGNYV